MKAVPFFLVLATVLSACNSPHPRFMRAQSHRIEVGGSVFQVRQRGDEVEIIRTNVEFNPKIGAIFPKATIAAQQATGCEIRKNTLKGDSALMRAKVECP
jgi:hypothetical protein